MEKYTVRCGFDRQNTFPIWWHNGNAACQKWYRAWKLSHEHPWDNHHVWPSTSKRQRWMQDEWRNQFLKTDWSEFYIIYWTWVVHQNYKQHHPSRTGILQNACTLGTCTKMLDGDHRKWHFEIAHAHLPQFTKGDKFLESVLICERYGCTISLFKYNNLQCSRHAQPLQQPKAAKVMIHASWNVERVTSQINELHLTL